MVEHIEQVWGACGFCAGVLIATVSMAIAAIIDRRRNG